MVTKNVIFEATGLNLSFSGEFQQLSLSDSNIPNSISFFDDKRYLNQLNENANVTGVFVTPENKHLVNLDKEIIVVDDPRWTYFTIYNYLAKQNKKYHKSQIHSSANIHPTAFVAENNVIIGKNTIIQPNVTILEDVEIGNDCIIGAGTVIGAEGFEYKKTSKGILSVFHDGKVLIGNNVVVGANNGISKGFSFRNTTIGDDTKTDNLVHIAHCVQIGQRCLLPAACIIAGTVTIEDDVWIGPNASITSGITIGKNGFITIGSTVTKSVLTNQKVTGYFAVEHTTFMKNFKKSL
jgi:UDP-3-O-[3-hydroxymyristoyl] glucosamine N-acyltransferase